MAKSRPIAWLLLLTGASLLFMAVMLTIATPAQAQCGSSASSCKNCHEVNAEYPVNGSGDWHTSHAFGDFCSFCHAGNVQAAEKEAAHEGMIYPLSDPQGSCQACHPADYLDEAGIYAVALGVDLGAADTGDSGSSSGGGGGEGVNPADVPSEPIPAPGERNASGALIDYNRRYEIEVLGIFDNSLLGNLILVAFALVLLGTGGLLIWRFEGLGEALRKARAVPEDDWRKLAYSGAYEVNGPVIPRTQAAPRVQAAPAAKPALPADLDKLDDTTKAALDKLLSDPQHGPAIIQALARLDSGLVDSLTSLGKKDRALLLAIVEQLGEDES